MAKWGGGGGVGRRVEQETENRKLEKRKFEGAQLQKNEQIVKNIGLDGTF